jgi:alcohol dehydrogenase class IV
VFSEIAKNPVKSNVLRGVEVFHEQHCEGIVGFGGGASMDVARAIALKAHHPLDLFAYDDAIGGDRLVTEEVPYFVTVPTTSGTGSEVGRSTVIADDITHEKKILFSPRVMAKKVFADPELTMGLPPFVTAATGMDALTHCVEAYLAKGFSPLCDGVALEGIRLIAESLEKATLAPDLESRAKMMMGALMGATAFQKGLGIVHSLAHPLSTLVDMHHGLANAVMIPYGMEFNLPVSAPRMKVIAEVISQVSDLRNPSGETLIAWLRELNQKIGITANLTGLKVDRSQIEKLADLAIQDPCHASNERPVSRADFAAIYTKACP